MKKGRAITTSVVAVIVIAIVAVAGGAPRRRHRIGILPAPRLPQRRDMIDVNSKPQTAHAFVQ